MATMKKKSNRRLLIETKKRSIQRRFVLIAQYIIAFVSEAKNAQKLQTVRRARTPVRKTGAFNHRKSDSTLMRTCDHSRKDSTTQKISVYLHPLSIYNFTQPLCIKYTYQLFVGLDSLLLIYTNKSKCTSTLDF
jgi:hypothetical protein